MKRNCRDCSRAFDARADYETRCWDCYQQHKREREQTENETWQERRERVTETPAEAYARQATRLVLDAFLAGRRAGEQDDARAWRAGYEAGLAAGGLDPTLLRDLVALCHPDRHPHQRFQQANRATAVLLELLDGHRTAA